MKAVVLHRFNDLDSLTDEEVPTPVIGRDEVLVQAQAQAVDPVDYKIAEGMLDGQVPMILGSTVAGEVIAVGEDVTSVNVGDRVAAQVRGGANYAEQVAVPVHLAAIIPATVSYEEAVSVVLGGQTAYQVIERGFNLQAGQKVLINGGSGAVGYVALQLALAKGAEVATTASGWGADMLRQQFPKVQVFDYKQDDFTTVLHDFDAALDTVGSEKVLADSAKILTSTGKLVSIVAHQADDPRFISLINKPAGENLAHLFAGLADGSLRTIIDQTLPLNASNVKTAYDRIKRGGLHGKVVFTR